MLVLYSAAALWDVGVELCSSTVLMLPLPRQKTCNMGRLALMGFFFLLPVLCFSLYKDAAFIGS